MKKILLTCAVLLAMVACQQNKPAEAVENENEVAVVTEAADSIDPQTKMENNKNHRTVPDSGVRIRDVSSDGVREGDRPGQAGQTDAAVRGEQEGKEGDGDVDAGEGCGRI